MSFPNVFVLLVVVVVGVNGACFFQAPENGLANNDFSCLVAENETCTLSCMSEFLPDFNDDETLEGGLNLTCLDSGVFDIDPTNFTCVPEPKPCDAEPCAVGAECFNILNNTAFECHCAGPNNALNPGNLGEGCAPFTVKSDKEKGVEVSMGAGYDFSVQIGGLSQDKQVLSLLDMNSNIIKNAADNVALGEALSKAIDDLEQEHNADQAALEASLNAKEAALIASITNLDQKTATNLASAVSSLTDSLNTKANELQLNLDAEISRAKKAESDGLADTKAKADQLQANIDTLTGELNTYKTNNDAALATEVNRAKSAESGINTVIAEINKNLIDLTNSHDDLSNAHVDFTKAIVDHIEGEIVDVKNSAAQAHAALQADINNRFTKAESDGRYYTKAQVYTRSQSDGRYFYRTDGNNLVSRVNNIYTKQQSDSRYYTRGQVYNRGESDSRYYLRSSVYTKGESDSLYYRKADVYTKGQVYPRSSVYTKAEVDAKIRNIGPPPPPPTHAQCRSGYTNNYDAMRRVNSGHGAGCDSCNLNGRWWRFRQGNGKMPHSSPGYHKCGTHAPGWVRGSYPAIEHGIVSRTVCFHWSGNTCLWSTGIRMVNCQSFTLYYLTCTPVCHLRFCVEG